MFRHPALPQSTHGEPPTRYSGGTPVACGSGLLWCSERVESVSLSGLLTAASGDPALESARSTGDADAPRTSLTLTGPSAIAPFAIATAANTGALVFAVTSTGREAEDLVDALRCLLPPDEVALYPGWETLPHERLSPRADTIGRRLAVLRRLRSPVRRRSEHRHRCLEGRGHAGAVGAAAAGARQLGDLDAGRSCCRSATAGRELSDIVTALASALGMPASNWSRNAGDFAVRGGILDVFPPTEDHPLRVEFWGDDRRGDPVLQGRRPAVARDRRTHGALGAAVPRDVAHRQRPRSRQRAATCSIEHPRAGSELLEPISRA